MKKYTQYYLVGYEVNGSFEGLYYFINSGLFGIYYKSVVIYYFSKKTLNL